MQNLNLVSIDVIHMEIKNTPKTNLSNIEMTCELKHSVDRLEDQTSCNSIVELVMYPSSEKDKESKKMSISMTIMGTFKDIDFEGNASINDELLSNLLPHIRAFVGAAMGAVGMQPILIPTAMITSQK